MWVGGFLGLKVVCFDVIEADVESVDRSVEVARMKKPCSRELLL